MVIAVIGHEYPSTPLTPHVAQQLKAVPNRVLTFPDNIRATATEQYEHSNSVNSFEAVFCAVLPLSLMVFCCCC